MGIVKGAFWSRTLVNPSFLVRLEARFFVPAHLVSTATRAGGCQGWPRSGYPMGLALIGPSVAPHWGDAKGGAVPLRYETVAIDRGELALGRLRIIASRPCIRWDPFWIQTMMQSYASTAKLRDGGSNLDRGSKAIDMSGTPPPRIVISSLACHSQTGFCRNHCKPQRCGGLIAGDLSWLAVRRRWASLQLSPNATEQ